MVVVVVLFPPKESAVNEEKLANGAKGLLLPKLVNDSLLVDDLAVASPFRVVVALLAAGVVVVVVVVVVDDEMLFSI